MDYQLISERVPSISLLEQVLMNRGFSHDDIYHYLHVDEKDICNPLMLDNMDEGVRCLINHIAKNSKALVIVDSDADGFTSSAVLLNYLNILFPHWIQSNVTYKLHQGKQHGLSPDLEINDEYNLIICPDSSSNDYEQHKMLREKGIDVLVLDHHEAEYVSPDAIIINNQLCDYPTKSLSGVGIVYKFCCYIDSLLQVDYAKRFLDMVAVGLIADMVSLKDFETHYFIEEGLQYINNPFLLEMVNRQQRQFESGITPLGIAFYIAPFINAMNRSGTMEEKLLLFESMLEWRADDIIPSTKRGCKGQTETRHEQAGRTCVNVKSRQKRAQDASLANIERRIEEEHLLKNKILVVTVPEEEVDKNLAGLIANVLAAKYCKPTLILREIVHENGEVTYEGSGRNYGKSRLRDLRQFLKDTGLVMYAEGHASAHGTGIRKADLDNFINKTNELLADFDFTPCYYVDLELDGSILNDTDIFDLASNESLWGQQMDEPLVAIKNVVVDDKSIFFMGDKKNTLRINLPNKKTSFIKFNISDDEKALLEPNGSRKKMTIIGKCKLNHYNGTTTPQIIIEDFEITNFLKYDF